MKMQFVYTGDVHHFVMAMMQGQRFTLTGSERSLIVHPELKEQGFSIGKSNNGHYSSSDVKMVVPVTLPEFGGTALMSFEYSVGLVQVAKSVPPTEEVWGHGYLVATRCRFSSTPEQTKDGIRFKVCEDADQPQITTITDETGDQEYLMTGAFICDPVERRSATKGSPEVKLSMFQHATTDTGVKRRGGMLITFA